MRKIIITEEQYRKLTGNDAKRVTVYVMCGIPGSGKSTWCQNNRPELPAISRDLIRAELGYTNGVDEKAVLTKEQENDVTAYEYRKMDEMFGKGQDFIIDDTNTNPFFRGKLIEYLRSHNAKIIGVNVNTARYLH